MHLIGMIDLIDFDWFDWDFILTWYAVVVIVLMLLCFAVFWSYLFWSAWCGLIGFALSWLIDWLWFVRLYWIGWLIGSTGFIECLLVLVELVGFIRLIYCIVLHCLIGWLIGCLLDLVGMDCMLELFAWIGLDWLIDWIGLFDWIDWLYWVDWLLVFIGWIDWLIGWLVGLIECLIALTYWIDWIDWLVDWIDLVN